ncbi:MAG: diguanylate cyclase [bacterium]
MEEQLKYQKDLLKAQQEAALDGILVVSKDGEVLSYNDQFLEMWGFSDSTIQDKSDDELFELTLTKLENPEEFNEKVQYLYENPDETSRDEIHLEDGRTFDRYSSPIEHQDDIVGRVWYFRDITNRKSRQLELEGFELLFENTSDCIAEIEIENDKPIIGSINKAFERTFGVSESELQGQNLNDVIVPDDGQAINVTNDEENGVRREVIREAEDGKREFLVRSVKSWEKHYYLVYTDITKRKQTQNALRQAKQELENANTKLEEIARQDTLTGLPNRRFLNERLRYEWNRAHRMQESISLLMLDIDHFKQYNDSFSHTNGDDVLRKIGTVLSNQVEDSDAFAARFGGEEFSIILPDTEPQYARQKAESIRREIENLEIEHADQVDLKSITVSIGFHSMVPQEKNNQDTLIKHADDALYRAKDCGRNTVKAHETEEQARKNV